MAGLPEDRTTEIVDVLGRLGLRTFGALADVPAGDVLARFGTEGALLHRLARGLDARPLAARHPAPDLAVTIELDPPVERVDTAAFVAVGLADELHEQLGRRGLACTRVAVVAETEHGETLERCWRHEGTLGAAAVAERVRWQLDGWLSGSAATRPTAGISQLTLRPEEVVAARGRQLGFWGGETLLDERAARALARVAGLLGRRGGPGARAAGRPWARRAAHDGAVDGGRPGREPPGRAARVGHRPLAGPAARSRAGAGAPRPAPGRAGRRDGPAGRGERPGRHLVAPETLVAGGAAHRVVAWAGPWPADERWWDPAGPTAAGPGSRWSPARAPPTSSPSRAAAGPSRPPTTEPDGFLDRRGHRCSTEKSTIGVRHGPSPQGCTGRRRLLGGRRAVGATRIGRDRPRRHTQL